MALNKNGVFEGEKISSKDCNDNVYIKKSYKKNNKRKIIANTYIIIFIFFTLIIPNHIIKGNIFPNITLRIQGRGYSYIFSSKFDRNNYPSTFILF